MKMRTNLIQALSQMGLVQAEGGDLDDDGLQPSLVQHLVQKVTLIATPQVPQTDQTQARTSVVKNVNNNSIHCKVHYIVNSRKIST